MTRVSFNRTDKIIEKKWFDQSTSYPVRWALTLIWKDYYAFFTWSLKAKTLKLTEKAQKLTYEKMLVFGGDILFFNILNCLTGRHVISHDMKPLDLSRVKSLTNMMASLCHAIIVFLHGFFKSGWYWMIPDKSRSFRIKSHLGKNWTRQELKTCKFYYGF